MCCDVLGVVGSNLAIFKLEPTTPNMSQHITARWPNARNMLRPTMLRYVALACCDPLAGALGVLWGLSSYCERRKLFHSSVLELFYLFFIEHLCHRFLALSLNTCLNRVSNYCYVYRSNVTPFKCWSFFPFCLGLLASFCTHDYTDVW